MDPDPIARFDRFDCVTFVEEVMALAWHAELPLAVAELQRIRYAGGAIRYGARNHLMIAQWIPENIARGFVRDVTAAVAGTATRTATLDLSDASFGAKGALPFELPPADRPLGHHEIPIVPVERLVELAHRIPHGTLISTVRAARPETPYRVTHVGLLLVVRGAPVVRHAHRGLGRVVEQPLERYLEAARRRQRWPIDGFNLLAIAPSAPASGSDARAPAGPATP